MAHLETRFWLLSSSRTLVKGHETCHTQRDFAGRAFVFGAGFSRLGGAPATPFACLGDARMVIRALIPELFWHPGHCAAVFSSSLVEDMAAPAFPETPALDELPPKQDAELQVRAAFNRAVLNKSVDNRRIEDEVEDAAPPPLRPSV